MVATIIDLLCWFPESHNRIEDMQFLEWWKTFWWNDSLKWFKLSTNKHAYYISLLYYVHTHIYLLIFFFFCPALHWMRTSSRRRGVWRSGLCPQTSLSSVSRFTGSWCSPSTMAALRATAAWPAAGPTSTSPVPPPRRKAVGRVWRTPHSSTNQ